VAAAAAASAAAAAARQQQQQQVEHQEQEQPLGWLLVGNLISSRVELSGVCDMVCLLKMLKPTAAGK